MGTCDVLILAKDNYFKEFIKLRESLNEIWSYKYEKLQKYDSKTGRIINTNRLNPIKKVIVIADAEGGNVEQVKESITKDIPEDFKDKVRYIIFKYSIEEWICDGLCIDNKGNPEETVNNYIRNNSISKRGYDHSMLPYFADKIDINKLENKNRQFKEFISYMQCIDR